MRPDDEHDLLTSAVCVRSLAEDFFHMIRSHRTKKEQTETVP